MPIESFPSFFQVSWCLVIILLHCSGIKHMRTGWSKFDYVLHVSCLTTTIHSYTLVLWYLLTFPVMLWPRTDTSLPQICFRDTSLCFGPPQLLAYWKYWITWQPSPKIYTSDLFLMNRQESCHVLQKLLQPGFVRTMKRQKRKTANNYT
jgi:hypothetical protein